MLSGVYTKKQKACLTEYVRRMITTINNTYLVVCLFAMALWHFIAAHIADVTWSNLFRLNFFKK